jgi:diguanylate cyclase (GGDEF)-like protein
MTATAAARGPGGAVPAPLLAVAALSALAGWTVHAACARRDPVTGLPGRAGWTAQARRIMRGGGTRTVILVDLDRFKRINDTYGHAAGDELLAVTAARLRTWAGRAGGGAAGRLGGDEFTAITARAVTDAETADLAALLARPAVLPGCGVTIPVTASVGAAPVGAAACAGRGLSAALAAADAAMYRAKHTGGGYRTATPAGPVPPPDPAPAARTRHHGPGFSRCVSAHDQVPRMVTARPGHARYIARPPPGRRFVYLAGSPSIPGTVVLALHQALPSSPLRNRGSQGRTTQAEHSKRDSRG